MGLDFNHGKAHWSYSGFNHFRIKLAKEIGVDLNKMAGYERSLYPTLSPAPPMPGRSWENIADPIACLLSHSDCDGDLTPEQCAKIAPRLRELVVSWKEHDYDKHNALLLAEGMEHCAKNNEHLEFW